MRENSPGREEKEENFRRRKSHSASELSSEGKLEEAG